MLKTYLKFTIRTFWRERFYTLLNILGLSVGMAVSVIILLYLQNDLTYDRHHQKHRQIYRLVMNAEAEGGIELHMANSARELGPMLQSDFPEIQSYVRFEGAGRTLVNVPGTVPGTVSTGGRETTAYNEARLMYTDPSVFEVFTHPFREGNPQTALRQANSIVLTTTLARKYFGDQSALGKTLWLGEGKEPYSVTGVMEDLPDNTHLRFDGLLSGMEEGNLPGSDGSFNSEILWNGNVYTYLLFPEDYEPAGFFAKFQPFYDQYLKPFGEQVNGRLWFGLEPLAEVHFYSQQDQDEPQGNLAYAYTFGGIGLFILLLACINYMNMATARAGNRSKEVGVRKVLGSSRQALFLTFLGESLLLSVMASILALGLVEVVLIGTPFNALIQKELSLDLAYNPVLLSGILSITLLLGLLSGLYPALYLPSLNTIKSLKGLAKTSSSGLTLRKTLVTFQFIISMVIVICTLLMQQQLDFMRSKELGFDKEHLLLVPIQDTLVESQIPVISHELQANRHILGTTVSHHVPGVRVGNQAFVAEVDSSMTNTGLRVLFVGKDYIRTMDMKLLAGRDFREDIAQDANGHSFIVNETAARAFGWYQPEQPDASPEKALDKKLMSYGAQEPGRVVGVVQDFNIGSLHNPIEPTVLVPMNEKNGSYFYIRLAGENLLETIDYLREQWARYDPNHPFEYAFLDQKFNEQYQADERQSTLIAILSGICLLIALLGVLGLSAYTAEQRTKEIGVRKVLGAKVAQIVYLLFSDVMYLILTASIIAMPVAYIIAHRWLQDFAYRTEMNVLLFLLVALAALMITFITMSFHSLKTAQRNPVDSLRDE
ncbi:MAG: FtsX-like permease family protein [Cyclobacteriaceae bacterium]